jgi:DNA (cytosine-5)-methyltransferase 1
VTRLDSIGRGSSRVSVTALRLISAGASRVTPRAPAAAAQSLVLSIFPGIDMLGRAFEEEGYSVVRGPDLIFGGDVRRFSVPAGRFDGVIGGSPCPDFSRARRDPPTGEGEEMLGEFVRCVLEAHPTWWLLENVPGVPDVTIPGYSWLRIDLDARECGLAQRRLRHFQFGHAHGFVPIVTRRRIAADVASQPCCIASEASRTGRRSWADYCELQGMPRDFDLPGMTLSARYRAVGNGVPLPMGRVLARAITEAVPSSTVQLCACGCARLVGDRAVTATAACRKRMQRRRDAAAVTAPGPVTPATSREGGRMHAP